MKPATRVRMPVRGGPLEVVGLGAKLAQSGAHVTDRPPRGEGERMDYPDKPHEAFPGALAPYPEQDDRCICHSGSVCAKGCAMGLCHGGCPFGGAPRKRGEASR